MAPRIIFWIYASKPNIKVTSHGRHDISIHQQPVHAEDKTKTIKAPNPWPLHWVSNPKNVSIVSPAVIRPPLQSWLVSTMSAWTDQTGDRYVNLPPIPPMISNVNEKSDLFSIYNWSNSKRMRKYMTFCLINQDFAKPLTWLSEIDRILWKQCLHMPGPLFQNILTSVATWISNHMPSKVLDETT